MSHPEDRFFRLGLVLAGGGARVRRMATGLPADEPLFVALSSRNAPRAILDPASKLADAEARKVIDQVISAGWRWIVPGDDDWPELLTANSDPPLGLFVRGLLDDRVTVAIVGSRKATPYGLQVARLLGEELGRAGVIVVSGMARGVDEAAHRGALDVDGQSWAVWGTGPDRIYPPEHGTLASELAKSGALLTEYPPGTPPRRHHFPERNRILAGLSHAVVVVEAAARSGALITARLAMEEGRDVLAVPGNIFSELSVGPNTLLRVGARPLLTPRDLFDTIGCEAGTTTETRSDAALLSCVGAGEALTADEIADRAGITVADALAELLALELAGEIIHQSDGRYSRARAPRSGGGGSTR
jgi:DNA processing protein